MILKQSISETRRSVPNCDTTKEFFDVTGQNFKESDKAKIGNLWSSIYNARQTCWNEGLTAKNCSNCYEAQSTKCACIK